MVSRARREVPNVPISVCGDPPGEHPADSFDAVLLSAVLTCVPGNEDQRAILREVHRVLRPSGVLFLSDFLLHSDARNQARYADSLRRFGTHGVFTGPGGATMRHHDPEHILMLTREFEPIHMAPFAATTMNGNSATGVLYIGREPAAGSAAD
jgi:ubiquinone/menaquinone biosynthesis C-methylase UbiE